MRTKLANSALLMCMFCIQTEGFTPPNTPDSDQSIVGRRSSIESLEVRSVKDKLAEDYALAGRRMTLDELEDRREGYLAGFDEARRRAARIAAQEIIDGRPDRVMNRIHSMGEEAEEGHE